MDGECGVVRGLGIWGIGVFVDGGIWGMEDRRVGLIENGVNLKLSMYAVFT